MNALLDLLKRDPPPKCERCKGSGIVTVEAGWTPEPCWCGMCGGTGKARVPSWAAPAHPGEEEEGKSA